MQEVDRTRRVATLIQREVSRILQRDINDSRINTVSVNSVSVSRDLKQATVYVSTVDAECSTEKIENLLNKASRFIRRELSQSLNLRITPGLLFKYDNSIERGVNMSQLIDSLNDVSQ